MALLKLYWISDKDQLESAYLMSREQMKYCYQVVLQTAVSKLVLHIDSSEFPNSQLVVFISWKQYNPPRLAYLPADMLK